MELHEYEKMAAVEETMWWYRALHEWLAARIAESGSGGDARLLDAGCGTGGFLHYISMSGLEVQATGLDLEPAALNVARGKSRADFVCGSVGAIPLGDSAFDIIISADVLYHRAVDESAAIAEMSRCLRRGGKLLLNLPAYEWMRSGHDVRIQTVRRYTARQLRRLLRKHGFESFEVGYRTSLVFPVMALWRLTLGRFSKVSDAEEFPAWQEKLFGLLMRLENRIAAAGVRFPFGGSVYAIAVKL